MSLKHPAIALLLSLTMMSSAAEATVLIFEPAGTNGSAIDQAYGDNVVSASQDGFSYGNGGEGFTPNVVTEYGLGEGTINRWGPDYGDLNDVIYREEDNDGNLLVRLTADAGFTVELLSLDLAGWPNADYTITSLRVFDQSNSVLFSQNNVFVDGTAGHSSFALSGVSGQSLTIDARIDLGSNSDNIGMDNIRFSQSRSNPSPVPEPMTLSLLGAGLAGIGAVRRRR